MLAISVARSVAVRDVILDTGVSVAIFARVASPKYPVPCVIPAGVRISLRYWFWKRMRASLVAGPKYPVSYPREPSPTVAIEKP